VNRGALPLRATGNKSAVRYGLSAIKGHRPAGDCGDCGGAQSGGAFKSLFDFAVRVDRKLNKRTVEALIKGGADNHSSTARGAAGVSRQGV
jgi:DNA polymerase-3 subunit alpha